MGWAFQPNSLIGSVLAQQLQIKKKTCVVYFDTSQIDC